MLKKFLIINNMKKAIQKLIKFLTKIFNKKKDEKVDDKSPPDDIYPLY
jgi:hypothetical protein|tara:strand:+ start:245 stop:388 length:144 start_codon:yes stop_codon:yes gene_type:complete